MRGRFEYDGKGKEKSLAWNFDEGIIEVRLNDGAVRGKMMALGIINDLRIVAFF